MVKLLNNERIRMKKIYSNPINRVIDLGINGDMCQLVSGSIDLSSTSATKGNDLTDIDYDSDGLARTQTSPWDNEW